jgi:hypothetical protein
MLAFSHFKQNLSRRRLSLCVNQCPLVSCTRKPGRHAFRYYIEVKSKVSDRTAAVERYSLYS